MKILYVDVNTKGHHLYYLQALSKNCGCENILIEPQIVDKSIYCCKQYEGIPNIYELNDFKKYRKFIKRIKEIADIEKVDIIHLLTGDVFYKYFGWGMGKLGEYKIVLTFHRVRTSLNKIISTCLICSKVNSVVVHSDYLKRQLNSYGIKNVYHIEYPQFNRVSKSKCNYKAYWGLDEKKIILGVIGGTRYDKGLDILLEALKKVSGDFQLLIAGEAEKFDEAYIDEQIKTYKEKVIKRLHYLTDDELDKAINACDVIVLPYRKNFNGASGPLGEGVCRNKVIIGPNHKNLGATIKDNKLGYTFEAENIDALTDIIDYCLKKKFIISEEYLSYKQSLSKEYFVSKYVQVYRSAVKMKGK